MGLLMPKYKLEFYNYHQKELEQGTNDRKKLRHLAQRGATNTVCDKIVLYEYKGLMQGYVIQEQGTVQQMLNRL